MAAFPATITIGPTIDGDLLLVKLAREIAIDHKSIETILEQYSISPEEWAKTRESSRFAKLLEAEVIAWESATNTIERTRLKAAAMVEEFLPEANGRLHAPGENLNAKVELLKVLVGVAGMGRGSEKTDGSGGEKFSVTINLGGDASLKFDKTLAQTIGTTIDAVVN